MSVRKTMIRHVSCHAILGATQEEVDRLYPDGGCIADCPNKHCSHGIFGTDQGDGTYDDTFVSAEAQRREREEIVKMVEGLKEIEFSMMTADEEEYNKALQNVINAIKERK